MISRAAIRLLAGPFAMAFALAMEMPAFRWPCSVHYPAFASLATANHGHQIAVSNVADHHLSHAGNHATPAPANSDQHQQKSHTCSCICCGSCPSPFTLAPAALTFAPPTISAGTNLPLPPIEKHARSIAEHTLPFSTAPPPPSSLIG
jgi:hypothetical protein